jgi:hypothetical protein
MANVPAPIHTVAAKVYEWWQQQGSAEPARPYLGGSQIGMTCERALWYGFHWAESKKFDGRLYRLFNRGHREESVIVQELRAIGVEVHEHDANGKQWSFSDIGGHFRGNLDAAVCNTPYSKKWAVAEMKTHNAKSFKDLKEKGVKVSKPQHYAQMIVYAGQTGMTRCFYFAVCKDTDEIYTEWIHFDQAEYDRLMQRASRVIGASEPPLKISNDASWYECKYCDYSLICHGTVAPQVNCRTCAHSTAVTDMDGGVWDCSRVPGTCEPIPVEAQRTGCPEHRYIPVLLSNIGEVESITDGIVTYRRKDGSTFVNGDSDVIREMSL